MAVEQDNDSRKNSRIGQVEPGFPKPQKEIQYEDRHHAAAMGQIMILHGLKNIIQRGYMLRRAPDQRIIVIIPMNRHPVIHREHKKENSAKNQMVRMTEPEICRINAYPSLLCQIQSVLYI